MLCGRGVSRYAQTSGPEVSATANGQVNSLLSQTCYAGVQFNTSGEEFEVVASNGNYSQSQGDWLTSGSSSDVWVERSITSGTWNSSDPGAGRLQLSTSRSFRVIRSTTGIQSVTGSFDFWDAASGGNNLQSTSSATYSAENEFDPCPICCFTPDTLITMADGMPMRIGDVKPGDLIKVERGVEPVGEVIVRSRRVMYRLWFEDGRDLILSEDHPIHAEEKGYACVNPIVEYKDIGITAKLEIGDMVTLEGGFPVRPSTKLKAIEHYPYTGDVYTFSNSRFYANGVLVY